MKDSSSYASASSLSKTNTVLKKSKIIKQPENEKTDDIDCKKLLPNQKLVGAVAAAQEDEEEESAKEGIQIDYMAKDYDSFRNALLEIISRKLPEWKDRSEADMGIVLIDLFSYVADELSYFQDKIANEVYLRTSTLRDSVKSHLDLIGYKMHNGSSASTFLEVIVKDGEHGYIPKGFQVRGNMPRGEQQEFVFETVDHYYVDSKYNDIEVIKLKPDKQTAKLRGAYASDLKKGQYILIEKQQKQKLSQEDTTATPNAENTSIRQIVRLKDDPKVIKDNNNNNYYTIIKWSKYEILRSNNYNNSFNYSSETKGTKVNANILLVNHGQTISSKDILKKREEKVRKSYSLNNGPLTFVSKRVSRGIPIGSKSTLQVWIDGELWKGINDDGGEDEEENHNTCLLEKSPFDKCYALSVDQKGLATVFFGDGVNGKKPADDSLIEAIYRVGTGSSGNIGENVLTHFDPKYDFVLSVSNPLAVDSNSIGLDIQSIEEAKIVGPKAIREQKRAITLKDYESLALDFIREEFRSKFNSNTKCNAKAQFVYNGSWNVVCIMLDVKNKPIERKFLDKVKQHMDRAKMIGYDVQIEKAKYVPLDIKITIYIGGDFQRSVVQNKVMYALSNKKNPDGTKGFFHPDNFSFGDRVYTSNIYKVLETIPEIDYIVIDRFRTYTKQSYNDNNYDKNNLPLPNKQTDIKRNIDEATKKNLAQGFIAIEERKIIRLDNDPLKPENGVLIVNILNSSSIGF